MNRNDVYHSHRRVLLEYQMPYRSQYQQMIPFRTICLTEEEESIHKISSVEIARSFVLHIVDMN